MTDFMMLIVWYLGRLVSLKVLQGLVQMAVGSRALALSHIEDGVHECLEALVGRHGATAVGEVLCHPERTARTFEIHLRTFELHTQM